MGWIDDNILTMKYVLTTSQRDAFRILNEGAFVQLGQKI